ncbi:MAG: hypothetical protein ACR2O2_18475, partial [Ruegeria sp.]
DMGTISEHDAKDKPKRHDVKKYMIPDGTNLTILVTLLSVIIALTDATVQDCSDFETAVFRLADEAETFQMTPEFAEHGWSKDGPAGNWMKQWEEIAAADYTLHLEFAKNYNFLPIEILTVAEAFNSKTFDGFHKFILYDIRTTPRCL